MFEASERQAKILLQNICAKSIKYPFYGGSTAPFISIYTASCLHNTKRVIFRKKSRIQHRFIQEWKEKFNKSGTCIFLLHKCFTYYMYVRNYVQILLMFSTGTVPVICINCSNKKPTYNEDGSSFKTISQLHICYTVPVLVLMNHF
jgi:hypothetical protein